MPAPPTIPHATTERFRAVSSPADETPAGARSGTPSGPPATSAMEVVLIAYAFPPYSAAGSARAAKVAEAFRRAGHSVHVITSRLPGEGPGPRRVEPGLTVQPVTTLPNPRRLVGTVKRLFGRAGAATASAAADDTATDDGTSKQRSAWKRHLLSLLLLPDDVQGFIPTAVAHVLRHHRGADLVYTTSPPASGHLAGLVLKLLTGVRWVTEFRDPWFPQRGPLTSWERNRIEGWLERQCIRRADRVISVSDGIHQMLRARLGERAEGRCAAIRNGIDSLAPEPVPAHTQGPERILYLGTLYWKRSPRLFLQGLAALRDRLRLTPGDVVVDFVGNCRSLGGESVEAMVVALGLEPFVRFHDWLPHEEARRLLDEATVLLLLAQEQPIQVPNKLYEYLGTRKPILAVADHDGETARMLRAVGTHYVATERDNVASMADLLERALRRRTAAGADAASEALLREWTTERQMRRLMEVVGAVRTG